MGASEHRLTTSEQVLCVPVRTATVGVGVQVGEREKERGREGGEESIGSQVRVWLEGEHLN